MQMVPRAIQEMLDELEASRQSRKKAWEILQRIRAILADLGNVAVPPPPKKTFEAEGEILQRTLQKYLRNRNTALQSLTRAVRRFRDATLKEECKADYPHALQAMMKAIDEAEDLIRR
jgi:hypothetical protein